jgi:hypothetical protein
MNVILQASRSSLAMNRVALFLGYRTASWRAIQRLPSSTLRQIRHHGPAPAAQIALATHKIVQFASATCKNAVDVVLVSRPLVVNLPNESGAGTRRVVARCFRMQSESA